MEHTKQKDSTDYVNKLPPIIIYNSNTQTKYEFENLAQASRVLDISYRSLQNALSGRTKSLEKQGIHVKRSFH